MPCDGSHMDPTRLELELSQVATLLDEINGLVDHPSQHKGWKGFHPRVYCKSLSNAHRDQMVGTLCTALKKRKVEDYSLEMQIWWRDHKAADQRKELEEGKKRKDAADRDAALKKLSLRERTLLGVKS